MPLYDFQCPKCEHKFEAITKYEAANPVCPECGAESERKISTPMVKVYDSALAEKQKDLSTYIY